MNSLDDKKPSIFNFYFFVGLTLIIASTVEVFLNDFLLSRLTLPLTLMTLIYWNVATPRNIGFFLDYAFWFHFRYFFGIPLRNSCCYLSFDILLFAKILP